MLNSILTLESDLINKKKYIWNTNRDSLVVFSLLAFRNIKIDGFVTTEKEQTKKFFLNTEVICLEDLQKQMASILIVSDECKKYNNTEIPVSNSHINVKFFSELLSFNKNLLNKKILVYGTNPLGSKTKKFLDAQKAKITAFLTLEANSSNTFEGKPVIQFAHMSELADFSNYAVVLAEYNSPLRNLMADFLEKLGVKNIYLLDELLDMALLKQSNFFLFIDLAIQKNRNIYLTGKGTAVANKIEEILILYHIPLTGYISDGESADENMKSIYDLYYESTIHPFVIIAASERRKAEEISNRLESIGLSINRHDYVGIYPVQWKNHPPIGEDCLVDYSTKINGMPPGVKVMGNGCKRIIILGGSTSTCDSFKPTSWVEFFYQKILERAGNITIYNLAHEGNDVVIELLRLLRDGNVLKPDYVISMSGVNNTFHKENMASQFNTEMPSKWLKALSPNIQILSGIPDAESLFSFWRRIELVIKAVAELYNATYIGFLQPMNIYKPHKTLFESMIMEDESVLSDRSFINESSEDDFYINLQNMFWNHEGMYIDNCHYSTLGNEKLADTVVNVFLEKDEPSSL